MSFNYLYFLTYYLKISHTLYATKLAQIDQISLSKLKIGRIISYLYSIISIRIIYNTKKLARYNIIIMKAIDFHMLSYLILKIYYLYPLQMRNL